MGTVISREAATPKILSDAILVMGRCRKLGGEWAKQGEIFLSEVVGLAVLNTAEGKLRATEYTDAVTARGIALVAAHDTVAKGFDDLSNELGRPARDLWLSILFPGGADCTDGPMETRPAQMESVVTTLETVGHPRIDKARTTAIAADIRVRAVSLRDALLHVDAANGRKLAHARVARAIADTAQAQLVAFKRVMLALHYSETEITTVIPDRGRKTKGSSEETTDTPSTDEPAEE